MEPTERETGKSPACGYGLLGLCCSSCLLGPCRISPFETKSAKGLCGDDADLMVAKNILRVVTAEAAADVKEFSEDIRTLGTPASRQTVTKRPAKNVFQALVEKYGLRPRISVNRFIDYFLRESKNLLSPLAEPRRSNMLPPALYHEGAFPHVHRDNLLPESLIGPIFDGLSQLREESQAVERILWQCLRTSLVAFICEELRRDVRFLTQEELFPGRERESMGIVDYLPRDPLQIVVILAHGEGVSGESIDRTTDELRERLKGRVPVIPAKAMSDLPRIGRAFFRKWSLPVNGSGSIVAVFSSSVSPALGALACGFTAVSIPALPIHGSPAVEKFLCQGIKERFGSAYLPPRRGEILPVILEFLGEKP